MNPETPGLAAFPPILSLAADGDLALVAGGSAVTDY